MPAAAAQWLVCTVRGVHWNDDGWIARQMSTWICRWHGYAKLPAWAAAGQPLYQWCGWRRRRRWWWCYMLADAYDDVSSSAWDDRVQPRLAAAAVTAHSQTRCPGCMPPSPLDKLHLRPVQPYNMQRCIGQISPGRVVAQGYVDANMLSTLGYSQFTINHRFPANQFLASSRQAGSYSQFRDGSIWTESINTGTKKYLNSKHFGTCLSFLQLTYVEMANISQVC